MFLLSILAFIICVALIVINQLIAKKTPQDREKMSPFECGFDPKSSARIPFSLRFYLIAVIFLIFDVEITLIMPIPLISSFMKNTFMMFISIFFVTILILGLMHEWNNGALNWDK